MVITPRSGQSISLPDAVVTQHDDWIFAEAQLKGETVRDRVVALRSLLYPKVTPVRLDLDGQENSVFVTAVNIQFNSFFPDGTARVATVSLGFQLTR